MRLLVMCLIFIPMLCHAAPENNITCPLKNGEYHLEYLTFYSGPPEEKASLAPDYRKGKKMYWSFSPTDHIYLGCTYHHGRIHLFQPLPPHTRTCVVEYNNALIPQKISCENE